jgi:two-component system LytT family response regulator
MIRRVLVVDDEPLARERVTQFVQLVAPDAEVRGAGDGEAAIKVIRAWSPDVVFLDIQMPGRDGFEVLGALAPHAMPPTVFVTAYDRHAIRAFEVAAVDYLLKPFDEQRFRAAWNRAASHAGMRALAAQTQRLAALLSEAAGAGGAAPEPAHAEPRQWSDRILVRRNQRTFVVKLADVEWVEASGNNIVLHSGRERHVVRESMASLEARVDPRQFIRIHRGTMVNVDAMKELQPWFGGDQVMILKDGKQLRVSRSYRERVLKQLAGNV